jgi:RNA polymerase sigma factor (sigma-70 family)
MKKEEIQQKHNKIREEQKQYDECKNMIWKLALNRYNKMKHKRPDVDFDDVLSEGFAIYAWCLKNFDSSKNMKFTTYLYMNLRGRLADYYSSTVKELNLYEDSAVNSAKNEDGDSFEEVMESKEYDIDSEMSDLFADADEKLSFEANNVIKYIVSREWESCTRKTAPSEAQIAKKFGYPRPVVDSIMSEIKAFWKKSA